MPPAARIRRRADFLAVQRRGKRRTSKHFVVLISPATGGATRIGITTSRRIGPAPARNRVRRLVREFFRRHRARMPPGADVVIIARQGSPELDYASVRAELARLLVED